MIRKGDILVCIEVPIPYDVSIGNNYTVLDIMYTRHSHLCIIEILCNDSSKYWFPIKHFTTIDNYRDITIDNITK